VGHRDPLWAGKPPDPANHAMDAGRARRASLPAMLSTAASAYNTPAIVNPPIMPFPSASATGAPVMFRFEVRASENLTFIPFVVRFHLDECGIRLPLTAWQSLDYTARGLLAGIAPSGDGASAQRFDSLLEAGIGPHAYAALERCPVDPHAAWRDVSGVPQTIVAQCALQGLPAPKPHDWARLDILARYTLAKLSRKARCHEDFPAALREFGLI
jgi:hypothetical protein